MPLDQTQPLIYLITSGATTTKTTPSDSEFSNILRLIEAAVAADVSLIQLREKELSGRVLYQLASRASAITRNTSTQLLVNDRFDIAVGAGANGVQLTAQSMPVDVIHSKVSSEFLIGRSTHSLAEAQIAQKGGCDFVVCGPVFETQTKLIYGPPQGIEKLQSVVESVDIPVIAIGGVTLSNVAECFTVGAAGIAAISLLNDASTLKEKVAAIRKAKR